MKESAEGLALEAAVIRLAVQLEDLAKGQAGGAVDDRSSPASTPSAPATLANRASEMLPSPRSSCARKRTESPARSASHRWLHASRSRWARTRRPTSERSGCFIEENYSAHG